MEDRAPRSPRFGLCLLMAFALSTSPSHAGETAPASGGSPTPARQGLPIADAAARAWASDAALVYVENDDELNAAGLCPRWGYLYFSPKLERARAWSVRGTTITVAEDVDVRFEAPALSPAWLDADQALAAAEKGGGGAYRKEFGGKLQTMLLMRGAVVERGPDFPNWTFVYAAPGAPSLYVAVNAADAKVARTWRVR